jgi:hypothetical protein
LTNAKTADVELDDEGSVLKRIVDKRNTLAEWVELGVPPEVTAPKNLSHARIWTDRGLGLQKIGSKRDFNVNHPLFGLDVRLIRDALKVLKRRTEEHVKQTRSTSKERIAELTAANAELNELLKTSLSELQTIGRLLEGSRRNAAGYEARSKHFEVRLQNAEAELADLRRIAFAETKLRAV